MITRKMQKWVVSSFLLIVVLVNGVSGTVGNAQAISISELEYADAVGSNKIPSWPDTYGWNLSDPFSNPIKIPTLNDWQVGPIAFSHGSEGEWDYYLWGGFANSLLKKGDTYFLYYQGSPSYDDQCDSVSYRAIGVATSTDGIHWAKSAKNPVISWSGQGSIEEGAASSAAWLGADGRIYVYYGANTGSGCSVNSSARLAVSEDGENFQDVGEVLSGSDPNVWGSGDEIFPLGVYSYGGRWHLYYTPNGVSLSRKLGVATGDNYNHFTQSMGINNSTIPAWGPVSIIPGGSDSLLFMNPNGVSGPMNIYRFNADNPAVVNLYDSYTLPDCTQSSVIYESSLERWLMSCRDAGANNYQIRYASFLLEKTATPVPTDTATLTSTVTASPTWTFTGTPTLTATDTATLTSTVTPSPTWTSTGTPTFTATDTATLTSTVTATYTPISTSTITPSPTGTITETPTFTPTDTATLTSTVTATYTPISTSTVTPSPTWTSTGTPTFMPTLTSTDTPTHTSTSTSTVIPSPTWTSTGTPTHTATITSTVTLLPTEMSTQTPTFIPTATLFSNTSTPIPSNLALNKVVSVSSYQDISHTGGMAEDGNLATYWQSRKATGKDILPSEWIIVDTGRVATITTIELEWDAHYATSYMIRISNDSAVWTSIFSTNAGDGGNDTIQLNPVSARYIGMESTAWSNSSLRNWLKEFEIFGYDSTHTPILTSTFTPVPASTITTTPAPTSSVHIGDMDGSAQWTGRNWKANVIVTIHDGSHNPVANTTINGIWSDGLRVSCLTDVTGSCVIISGKLAVGTNTTTLTISNVASSSSYAATNNHDPDGDSDGSIITVQKP